MKRFGFIVATALIGFSACGKGTSDLPPAAEFPAPGEAAKTVVKSAGENTRVLRYVAKVDAKNEADMDIDLSIDGGGMEMGFKMKLGALNSITAVDPAGNFTQAMEITSASVTLGGKLAEMGGDSKMFDDMMKGMKMSFKMDPQGRMLEADLGDKANPMMGQMQAGMDQAMQGGVVPFPTEAVGIGAQWEALSTVDMMGAKARMVANYKLVALDGDKGTLEFTLKGSADAQKMTVPNAPGEVDLKALAIDAEGKIGFDLGNPTAGSVDMKMNMRMDLSAQGQSADMKMGMIIKMAAKP